MNLRILELTANLSKVGGANDLSLEEFKQASQVQLPPDYVEFMKYSNGAEGAIGRNGYVALWSIEEILPLNRDGEFLEFAPGLLVFGTDGGNTGYAFDTRKREMPIVEVPLIGMALDQVTPCGRTFSEFLEYLNSQ